MEETTYINDPVHGIISLHPLCRAVVDTPEFQRLRFIKQTGVSSFVYPGATHTRFEHSLGVSYLAQKVIAKLNEISEDRRKITDRESICLQLAGLCHDLGHGPFSHLWEHFVLFQAGERFEHENMSAAVLDHLIKKNGLMEKFNSYGLNEEDVEFIKQLILGEQYDKSGIQSRKAYLFEIIANKENGLDVDKYEYLMRDSYNFGIKLDAGFQRYVTCLKLVTDADGVEHISFKAKLKANILNTFKLRAEMHNIAYQHPISLRIETMLLDALKKADPYVKKNGLKLSECHKSVEALLQLTDSLFQDILNSNDDNLQEAKDILIKIMKRELYYQISELELDLPKSVRSCMSSIHKYLHYLEDEINQRHPDRPAIILRGIVKCLSFGQNDTNGNPLASVRFEPPDTDIDLLLWLPKKYTSKKLYVFCNRHLDNQTLEEISVRIRSLAILLKSVNV